MTDERDPKVSQRYRELPGEEPTRELDQTILAAAHRAADKPHAPLVVPAGRHRWYFSLAAAAILVLAVAVTVHVERQQPDAELAVPAAPPPGPQGAPATQGAPAPEGAPARAAKPQAKLRQEGRQVFAPEPPAPAPTVPPPVADAAPPRADEARLAEERAMVEHAAKEARDAQMRKQRGAAQGSAEVAASAPRSSATPAAQNATVSPERELERIADLRAQGRDEEADKALAEFHKRYPGYQIPEAMRKKVEKKATR